MAISLLLFKVKSILLVFQISESVVCPMNMSALAFKPVLLSGYPNLESYIILSPLNTENG